MSNKPSNKSSFDQQRAAQAWQDVGVVDSKHRDKLGRKYNSLARSAPAMVQSNGLGQTLAFFRAKAGANRKKESEHWLLYTHISHWVMAQLGQKEAKLKDGLLEWIVQQDTQTYRRATAETLAYMGWLKRFAEAVLPEAAANEE
ncbi:MAG: type III-B CRISPR module-associated protein Cmr5 [Chloroflexi bacterium]|nr:type III-B CRISPR module-associated protein Cmr5 [Chloroflexota bacterium]